MNTAELVQKLKSNSQTSLPNINTLEAPGQYGLWILAATQLLGVNDLTAVEIVEILLEGYGYHYSPQAISSSLSRLNTSKKKKVKVTKGSPCKFRILKPGLESLEITDNSNVQNGESNTITDGNNAQKKKVFVVHGRNSRAKTAMHDFLRSINLTPIEWISAIHATGNPSPFIEKVVKTALSDAQAVVVLFTPDDEVRLKQEFVSTNDHDYEKKMFGQARPNVLFEAGRAIGIMPDRTVFVELGNIRPLSDLAGIHVVKLSNKPDKRQELAQKLKSAGCSICLDGTDWHSAGDFTI